MAVNYRKKMFEEVPKEETKIWSCTKEDCNGWMRDNFMFEHNPTCPLCQSAMVSDTRMLPVLVNSAPDQRPVKTGQEE